MPYDKDDHTCFCYRCDYIWKATPDKTGKIIEPTACAGCKQTNWNKERKYKTKKSFLVITRRDAPSGRRAAKLKFLEQQIKLFDI